ncbi:MAG: hypothetical protein E6G47_05825 [Actinobacteria bacterium]|nr:MAG: hypothetical protein E6G47_05825 [Actinomycetota bacterium]
MTDGASPEWEQADPSAEDEQALYGAHTPVWAVAAPASEVGVSWADAPAEEPSEAPENSFVPAPPPPAPEPAPEQPPAPVATAPAPVAARPAPAQAAPDLTSVLAGEEIAGVLQAAEQAARRIVERAQESAQMQLADMRQQRSDLEDHAAQLAAWREQLTAVIRPMAAEIEVFRSALEEIPQRISEAFALVADRVPAIQQDLAELARALGPASGGSAQEPGDRQARLAG